MNGLHCALLTIAATLLVGNPFRIEIAGAAPPGGGIAQQTFASPQEGVKSLLAALRSGNRTELLRIFGPDAADLVSSGDDVADRAGRERVLAASAEMTRLVRMRDGTQVIYMGKANWPLPIPLVKTSGGKWRFDTARGMDEIVNRRIGRNELAAIGVSQAYVAAQGEYQAVDRDGDGVREYAQRLRSDPGKKDGLYWSAEGSAEPSPLGPLVAAAVQEGYGKANPAKARSPYHGYFFRVLTAQGKHAHGGAKSYLKDGHMTKGFALVAWPADYGASGIMTFLVNQDGIVLQKDLGDSTARMAETMPAYDPGAGWTPVESGL